MEHLLGSLQQSHGKMRGMRTPNSEALQRPFFQLEDQKGQ